MRPFSEEEEDIIFGWIKQELSHELSPINGILSQNIKQINQLRETNDTLKKIILELTKDSHPELFIKYTNIL